MVYEERMQFMTVPDAVATDGALLRGEVSAASIIWSSAAEDALRVALSLEGGPVPDILPSDIWR